MNWKFVQFHSLHFPLEIRFFPPKKKELEFHKMYIFKQKSEIELKTEVSVQALFQKNSCVTKRFTCQNRTTEKIINSYLTYL